MKCELKLQNEAHCVFLEHFLFQPKIVFTIVKCGCYKSNESHLNKYFRARFLLFFIIIKNIFANYMWVVIPERFILYKTENNLCILLLFCTAQYD